jgi:hypothetical protein
MPLGESGPDDYGHQDRVIRQPPRTAPPSCAFPHPDQDQSHIRGAEPARVEPVRDHPGPEPLIGVQQQPAHRGRGVDRLGGRPERHLRVGEVVEQVDQVPHTAGEPVQPVDQQHVQRTEVGGGRRALQAGPLGGRTEGVVGESLDHPPVRL